MRTIKFKCWNEKLKRMSKPFSLSVKNLIIGEDLMFRVKEGDVIFLEFTGLLDKHGKEIYEFDIVEDDENIEWEVRWEFNQWVFISQNTRRAFVPESVEIIGNIFENSKN